MVSRIVRSIVFLLVTTETAWGPHPQTVAQTIPDMEARGNSPAALPEAPVPAAITLTSPTFVSSTVTVNGDTSSDDRPDSATIEYRATSAQIESSAGTYGDLSRYLQMFPGVVFNSDESDDVLVRGGNPIENLYLVDGIEVPNINHIATGATTGGLVSMIDSSAIHSVDFETGGYDASYEERLSSVISIHPRELTDRQAYTAADAGFVGAGFIRDTPFRRDGSLLVTAHRSLLNLFTKDIGLNGVPIYTNLLSRAEWNVTQADHLSMDTLAGIDSIKIKPTWNDDAETNTIDTEYSGWRATNGVRWRHSSSPQSFVTWTLSDSEQSESINQQDQLFNNTVSDAYTPANNRLTPVYSELTHDGMTNLRIDGYRTLAPGWTVLYGGSGHVNRIAYTVDQPFGEQSPLNADPARSDATSFSPHFWTTETGLYGQTALSLSKWHFDLGGRFQQFAFGDHLTLTPRIGIAYAPYYDLALHVGISRYRQLPPFLQLTSFPGNRFLSPIEDTQLTAGIRWKIAHGIPINLELYRKEYRAYPVSTEYSSLSLANLVDTLGQEFIWLPLTSRGTGYARGVELSTQLRLGTRVNAEANASLSKTEFAALDGVNRPGNFDYPFVFNLAGRYLMSRAYGLTWRYEYTTGRPYTPFLLSESAQQDRPIYDLTRINQARGPFYSRLDFRANRIFPFGSKQLSLYGGLENALDRKNFLGIAWLPRYGLAGVCVRSAESCVSEQDQMGIFPDFGAVFNF